MITGGCINVEPVVYEELVKCCYASKLVIKLYRLLGRGKD